MKTRVLITATLIIATMAFVLGACKTVKQSQDTTLTNSSDVTVNQTSETNNDLKLKVDSTKLTIDKGNVSEVITEETTTVVYAPADSSGKQAVVSITTTKRGITRNENKNLHENKSNSSDLRDKGDSKSDARVNASSENKTKEKVETKEERKTPGWVYYISTLCLVVFLGFVFFKVTK